jgi:hypothetical protein
LKPKYLNCVGIPIEHPTEVKEFEYLQVYSDWDFEKLKATNENCFDTGDISFKKVLLELHSIKNKLGKDISMSEEYLNSIVKLAGNRKMAINVHLIPYVPSEALGSTEPWINDIYRVVSEIPDNEIELWIQEEHRENILYISLVGSIEKKATKRFRVFIISKTQKKTILRTGCWVRRWMHPLYLEGSDVRQIKGQYKGEKPNWFKLGKEIARMAVKEVIAEIELENFDVYLDNPIEVVLIEKIRF